MWTGTGIPRLSARIFWSSLKKRLAIGSARNLLSIRAITTTSIACLRRNFWIFKAFQRREVAKLAKEMVDITHEYGKER